MGYSHGKKWDDEKICSELREIIEYYKFDRMPSLPELKTICHNCSLSNAISRHGGVKKFADILGVPIKKSEFKLGNIYEGLCITHIKAFTQLDAEKMTTRYPYDILVNGTVKVDCKSGVIYKAPTGFEFYTFNLEKKNQTCDVFVCYCLDLDLSIDKVLVIPSCVLHGKSQLSVGIIESVYDKYKDAWHIIKEYNDFMESMVEGWF